MISVRCPSCQKAVGFDEADGGARVACPFCGESFFVPSVVVPVAATAPAPTTPAPLPEDLRLADLDPAPEPLPDELLPAEGPAPAPQPQAVPRPDLIPDLQLDPVRPEPPAVRPTDVAPSLSAAAALSDAVPAIEAKPEPAPDVLEEVAGPEDETYRLRDEQAGEVRRERRRPDRDDDEPRPRRGPRKNGAKRRPPPERPSWPVGWTRDRAAGAVGLIVGGAILLGTLLHHLTGGASAWHAAACCGDLFGLALCGVGLYFVVKG